jgi:hypothetical protein
MAITIYSLLLSLTLRRKISSWNTPESGHEYTHLSPEFVPKIAFPPLSEALEA